MQIIEIKNIEECIDENQIIDIILDKNISKDFIREIGRNGTLEYYSQFPKPFFKITFHNNLYLKGVQGNSTLRVFTKKESDLQYIKLLIHSNSLNY